MTTTKHVALILLGIAMMGIGVDHFVNPAPFVRIVPSWLPAPAALVAISGVFEVLGGIGVLVPMTRKFAAWGLIALYISVFPANVNMALNHIQLSDGDTLPVWAMWARLPLQALLIAWAAWFTRDDARVDLGADPSTTRPA